MTDSVHAATFPPPSSIENETRRLLLAMLNQHLPGMVLSNLFVATLFAALFWHEKGAWAIWAWWILPVAVNLARWQASRRLNGLLPQLDAARLHRAERLSNLLTAVSGLAWGSLAWIVYDGSRIDHDFVTIAIIVGMTGGAVTPLSTLRNAFQLYAPAAILPFIIKAFWIGGSIYMVGGLTLLAYLAILLGYGRTIHRALKRAFKLQLEKDELLRQLELMAHSRSLFLAAVSHDLKQPVQALGMFTNCLESHAQSQPAPLGTELTKLANNSRLALAAISGQLSRLLELTQLESGEVRPRRRNVSLTDIFEYTHAQQSEKAGQKGVRLDFIRTDVQVVSDLKMLQSILDNLVSNAVRCTSSGRVLVGIRRRGGRSEGQVEIQVWDTGPGIPEAHIPRLFEAYQYFDDTVRGSDTGSGLGLALVKKQAELLNHDLSVHSWPGRGSLFSIIVPRARGEAP